jgi:hypothetical protein
MKHLRITKSSLRATSLDVPRHLKRAAVQRAQQTLADLVAGTLT